MRCVQCKGPAHPATGWYLSPEALLCGPCAGRLGAWLIRWTAQQKRLVKSDRSAGRVSFYEAAATSVKPADMPGCACSPWERVRCTPGTIRCPARTTALTAVGAVCRWLTWITVQP